MVNRVSFLNEMLFELLIYIDDCPGQLQTFQIFLPTFWYHFDLFTVLNVIFSKKNVFLWNFFDYNRILKERLYIIDFFLLNHPSKYCVLIIKLIFHCSVWAASLIVGKSFYYKLKWKTEPSLLTKKTWKLKTFELTFFFAS